MNPPNPPDRDLTRMLELAQEAIEIDESAKNAARTAMRSVYEEEVRSDGGRPIHVITPDHTEIGVAELVRVTTAGRSSSRWRLAAVAAAALVLVAGLAISARMSDRVTPISPTQTTLAPPEGATSVPTTDPSADTAGIAAAEAIGMQFMQARADYDSTTLVSLLAPDASFSLTEPAQTMDEIPLQAEWERAVGWQFLDPSCTAFDPDLVVCTYTVQGPLNERIGKGPYPGNSFRLEISDGRIQHVDHTFNAFDFFTDTEVEFYIWIGENHPDDLPLMLEGDRLLGGDYPSFPHLNPESIRLWEERTSEYLASLG